MIRLSEYLWCPGRVAESWDAARESVALLERLEPCLELGRAYGQLAFLARTSGDGESATAWGERALEWAERTGDLPMLVGVLAALGEAEILQGAEWSDKLDRAVELAEEHGLVEALGWLPHLVARILISSRSYPEASRVPDARRSSSPASTVSSSTGTTTSRTWHGPSSTRATGRPPRT